MPSALIIADLPLMSTAARGPEAATVRAIAPADVATLAHLCLASYPPTVGAATLEEATAEMQHTFDGTYGHLRLDLSLLAVADGTPAGAVLTTTTPIWDEIDAPFLIDFFVHPDHRQLGIDRLLLKNLADRAVHAGAQQLALRVNDGTIPQAHHLYQQHGFRQLDH